MEMKQAIAKTLKGEDLTQAEATAVAMHIMGGGATDAQIGALLMTMRTKGESIDEITGFAKTMREKATVIRHHQTCVVDTCGTGGDCSGTFNISTVSALVAAGAGCCVAKHGNRSVSSQCGSADVLKAMGVKLDVTPEIAGQCIDETGIGFLFAPLLHAAMKHAIGPRREIGVRSIFNVLGPLTNPAGASRQVMGVFDGALTEPLANVLNHLGAEHVMVVHGSDGLDEITLAGPTRVSELNGGRVRTYDLDPNQFGLPLAETGDLKGGDPETNARIAIRILKGEKSPKRDIVVLNAGAVIFVGGCTASLEAGIEAAEKSIDSGAAYEKLEQLIEITNR